jgi:hypothetical protein
MYRIIGWDVTVVISVIMYRISGGDVAVVISVIMNSMSGGHVAVVISVIIYGTSGDLESEIQRFAELSNKLHISIVCFTFTLTAENGDDNSSSEEHRQIKTNQ